MEIASQVDERMFTVKNGIVANLLVVLIGSFLIVSSAVSNGVGLLLIAAGIVGMVINTAYARRDHDW